MNTNPTLALRKALQQLLDEGKFNYEEGETRKLVRQAQRALIATALPVTHERPVGIYKYDPKAMQHIPAKEEEALDKQGKLLPGYEYLFRQPNLTRH